jgi:preprotein translocase subunit SecF
MTTYRLISRAAFTVAIALLVVALVLLTGSYTRMQNIAVVLLIGFGVLATVGMFFAADPHGLHGPGGRTQDSRPGTGK